MESFYIVVGAACEVFFNEVVENPLVVRAVPREACGHAGYLLCWKMVISSSDQRLPTYSLAGSAHNSCIK